LTTRGGTSRRLRCTGKPLPALAVWGTQCSPLERRNAYTPERDAHWQQLGRVGLRLQRAAAAGAPLGRPRGV